jgi:Tol biopolymer transport system component
MGEVYRARDTRLDRVVALKVLPAHVAQDPERRQRFEREARAISSLNHPNICSLYDIGRQDGVDYLVMEYLEGKTLAARLDCGALPAEQVLRVGIEIADALEKAHRQGVIHRDLKPGNIMLTKMGAKLLDFGLAKATAPAAGAGISAVPTESKPAVAGKPLTGEGKIVGTFQYMAPEQLEGEEADARSDIFAFGAVLYEMATGRKAFEGKSQASLVAAILHKEPAPISELQPMTPPALGRVVKTCLAKDADERWQTAHDLKLQLQWVLEAGSQAGVAAPVVARRKIRERLAWGLAAVALLAAVGVGVVARQYARRAREMSRVVRSSVLPPENATFLGVFPGMAVSPDGRRLAFVARGADGKALIWVRGLDSLSAQPLAGTDGASQLFWSPDSRFIAYNADGKLKKIEAAGGPALTLSDAVQLRGATWNSEGVIVFAPTFNGPLYRVSAAGGAATQLTKLDEARRENAHRWPWFLPDGKHFLYLARGGSLETNGIYVGSLDGEEPKLVLREDSGAAYASPGYLLFVRQETLMAQRFDAGSLETVGEASPLAEHVRFNGATRRGVFSVSDNGVLVYVGGTTAGGAELLWMDRAGKQLGVLGGPGFYGLPRLSPDGKRAVVYAFDAESGNADLWLYDVARGILTRFTFDPMTENFPVWSPAGSGIVFASNRKGQADIYQKAATGAAAEEVLLATEAEEFPASWSPDGRYLAYLRVPVGGKTRRDIWILPLFGDRKPFSFIETDFDEYGPEFSPDGRWLAYNSDESGRQEVYVVPFPGPGGKWQVSTAGGSRPQWRRDARELFYLGPDDKLMAVEIRLLDSTVEIGVPKPLLQTTPPPVPGRHWDATADGRRFLTVGLGEGGSPPLTLVVNWPAELDRPR